MITLKEIQNILYNGQKIIIKEEDYTRVNVAFDFLTEFSRKKVIYGINTGFGPMAQYRINDADLNALQYNIIRSHACGAGQALSPIEVNKNNNGSEQSGGYCC